MINKWDVSRVYILGTASYDEVSIVFMFTLRLHY